jgi:uncharacterized protein YxjI
MYLACYPTFELYRLVLVDEPELCKHSDPLLVVRQQFEILIGQRQLEACDVRKKRLFHMHQLVLLQVNEISS